MASQEDLASLWLEAPEGKLCGREQAKAWALREVWRADEKGTSVTVEDDGHIDFADFNVEEHAGVLLDGLGDVQLLKTNRESLQGRPKVLKGGRSQTMRYAYPFTLARRAVVVTMDLSADNLHLLDSDHWLSNSKNVVVVRLSSSTWLNAPSSSTTARDDMTSWSVAEVTKFFAAHDLCGPASILAANGVRGRDLVNFTLEDLKDMHLSGFAMQRLFAARDEFLR